MAPPAAAKSKPALLLPALAMTLLISSATFLVAKRTLAEFPPLPLALFRFVLAASLLGSIVRAFHRGKRIAPVDRPRIWLLGFLSAPLNQALFLVGMQWASASHAALLYALTPTFVVLILLAGGGGRPSVLQLAGIVLAFAGVVLLLVQRGLHFDRHSLLGDVIVVTAVVAWGAYLALGTSLTRRYGPLLVTSEAMLAGAILYLPIGLISLRGFDPSRISPMAWAGLFYLAWLTSGVNYVLWFWGLQHLKPTTVATLTNAQPIVAAAMARGFLGERLPAGFVISAVLVLAGVWITRVGGERVHEPQPAEPDAAVRPG
jgi:drug/metabolite transporter (DMT)-like permease